VKKEGFPKSVHIKKESDFRQTFLHGVKKKGECLIIFRLLREDQGGLKFGIKVGRGIKNAVTRNRIKRNIREVLRKNRMVFCRNENVVVLVRPTAAETDIQKLKLELQNLIR
jgi:ribonuclease P protein component